MTSSASPDVLPFEHLARMTDDRSLFEHALHATPRPEHGYCVDDAARALVVVCEEQGSTPELVALCRVYLSFCLSAVSWDGRCHNRMTTDGTWSDEPSVGDWWGRAVWALGVAAVHAPTPMMRGRALLGFRSAARQRSPHRHAMAFAALGAGPLLLARPDELGARRLLRDAAACIGRPGDDPAWPWPEPRLRYASGTFPAALLQAGLRLGRADTVSDGLALLDFLVSQETRAGRLSVTPVGGRGPGDPAPAFPQQPIEVVSLAQAAGLAFEATGDPRWNALVVSAWRWFLGDNDSGTVMVDEAGGGFDGLQALGRNRNRGAESTLAALSTCQLARRAEAAALPPQRGPVRAAR